MNMDSTEPSSQGPQVSQSSVQSNLILHDTRPDKWANKKKRSYDPIDYESIADNDFWVVDDEPEGELEYDELENMLEEEPRNNSEPFSSKTQASEGEEVNEDEDDLIELDDDDDDDDEKELDAL
ncbi:hypothetical protein L1987_03994 [Smallanthus sonchifolius]|uniref:Uncharacterized protein n=1 Tax=Smallanthus sonchifolius TaxID=185202 RepID=A0ACB9KC85_9ASTR|nr:hypothetical protein L1987_03994 [Smallanthus sonchifolius]